MIGYKVGAVSRSIDWYPLLKVGGVGAGIVGLLIWQWELLAATAIGVTVMGGIYLAYDAPWEKYLEELYQLWHGESRRLIVSVLSGGSAVFVSYLAIALWQSSENHWLVTASLMQGLMIGGILLLSLGQNFGRSPRLNQFEAALENLSHRNTVKRLYAMRHLRRLLQHKQLSPKQTQTLYTFLRLAWKQETDSALRGALLSTLSLYQTSKPSASQPLRLKKTRLPLKLDRLPLNQPLKERV